MQHEQALAFVIAADSEGLASVGSPLVDASGTSVNELGSTATFTFGAGALLTGTYTSKVSAGGGTISGPITGYCSGYTITWSVLWLTNPPAITSWTGEAVRSGLGFVIETLWYMVTQTLNAGDPSQFWTAVNAGADTFTPHDPVVDPERVTSAGPWPGTSSPIAVPARSPRMPRGLIPTSVRDRQVVPRLYGGTRVLLAYLWTATWNGSPSASAFAGSSF